MSHRGFHWPSFFLLMINVVFWATSPLFIKYFSGHYNVWTQNAFRYISASGWLFAWAAIRGTPLFRLNGAQWRKLCLIALINIGLQSSFASTYYFIYPSVASLIHRVSVPLTVIISFIVFHDERPVVRSPLYLGGSLLALAGVAVVIVGRDPDLLQHLNVNQRDFWIGVGLAAVYAAFLAFYAITIKHTMRSVAPIISFTHVSWMSALGLSVMMLASGGTPDLWRQPATPLLLMVLSALLFIVIAHASLYAALRELKASVTISLMQLTPVFTCAFSALVYRDYLSGWQIAGGVVVIVGAWLAGLAQARMKKAKEA